MPRLFSSSERPKSSKPIAEKSKRSSTATTSSVDIYEDEYSTVSNSAKATMDKLDTYIEKLYENITEKLIGTAAIRDLVSNSHNLFQISSNDSIISALSRVLAEDGRRSMELSTNILFIFLSMASIVELRPKLLFNRVGDATMKTIQRELGRFSLWNTEIESIKESGSIKDKDKNRVLVEKISKIKLLLKRQDELFFVTFHLLMKLGTDIAVEVKMVKRDVAGFLTSALDIQLSRSTMFSGMKDHNVDFDSPPNPVVLDTILTMILHLSQFKENQMRMLDLNSKFLMQILQVQKTMEKKLQIKAMQIMSNLLQTGAFRAKFLELDGFLAAQSSLISDPHEKVSSLALKLIYFTSMAPDGRDKIADTSIIPNVMRRILESSEKGISIELGALVCNLALDANCCAMICGEGKSSADSGIGLKLVLKRAIRTLDPLLWKLIRTISQTCDESTRIMFVPHVDDIMKFCAKLDVKSTFGTDQEAQATILISIIGILGCLDVEGFDFTKLNHRYGLLSMISYQMLTNINMTRNSIRNPSKDGDPAKEFSQALEPSDDILLECIVLLDTMISTDDTIIQEVVSYKVANPDANSALVGRPSAASGRKSSILPQEYSIPQLLVEILNLKQDDFEVTVHTLRTIYSLLCADAVCETMIRESKLVDKLHGLIWETHETIRSYVGLCLSLLEDYEKSKIGEEGYISRVSKEKRFQYHNAEWVMSVQDSVLDMRNEDLSEDYDEFNRLEDGQGMMVAEGEDLFWDDKEEGNVPNLETENVFTVHGQHLQFV